MKLSNETIDELTILIQQLMEIQINDNEIDHVVIYSDTMNLNINELSKKYCIFANHEGCVYDDLFNRWIIDKDKIYTFGKSIYVPSIEEQQIFTNLFNFMNKHSIGSMKKNNNIWTIVGRSVYDSDIYLNIEKDALIKFAGKI